jgi:hypothetical protein
MNRMEPLKQTGKPLHVMIFYCLVITMSQIWYSQNLTLVLRLLIGKNLKIVKMF